MRAEGLGDAMKKELELLRSARPLLRLTAKTLLASGLRTMERRPEPLDTVCEPIVLMHGFSGFREINLGAWTVLEYFTGVRRLLRAMGYRVFAPEVAPFDDPYARAKQWERAIDDIRARTGAEKVHLVGHSQGGLDARVLAAPTGPPQNTPIGWLSGLGYGRHIASVTTLATPHFGSFVADAIEQEIPVHEDAVNAVKRAMELIATIIKRKPQNVDDAVTALTRAFMLEHFNPLIEDDPGVRYYAVAGDPVTEDFIYPLLRPIHRLLEETSPSQGGGPNDGLVTVTSSLFGHSPPGGAPQGRPNWTPLGVLQADHIAEVGIPLHVLRPDEYDHFAFFAGLAQFLDDAYTAKMKLRTDGRWERTP